MERRDLVKPYIILFGIIIYLLSLTSKSFNNIYQEYHVYLDFMLIIAIFFLSVYDKKRFINYVFYIILVAIYDLATLIFFTDGGIGSVLNNIFIPFYVLALTQIIFTEKANRTYLKVFSLYIFIMPFFAQFIHNNYSWTLNNYVNPNTYGMTACYCFIYSCIFLKELEVRWKNKFMFVLFVLSMYTMYVTECRMATLTTVLFLVLDFILPKSFFTKKRLLTIIAVFMILSVLFPFVYVALYTNNVQLTIPFSSKSFYTGRETLWTILFTKLGNNPQKWFFGIGSKVPIYVGRVSEQHIHNNALQVLTCFGIVGLFSYYLFLFHNFKIVVNTYLSDKVITSVLVFICFLFEGFTENSMVGINLFPLLCFGLAFSEVNKEKARQESLI